MKAIIIALQEVYGLFVEDGSLAVGILLWLAINGWLLPRLPVSAGYRAPLFFVGLCVLLLENVVRSARAHQRGADASS